MYIKSLLDILKLSVSMEEDGEKLYLDLYMKSTNEEHKNIFRVLAEEEKIHRKVFRKLFDNLVSQFNGEVSPGDFNIAIPEDLEKRLLKLLATGQEPYAENADFKTIIEGAVKQEYLSIEVYQSILALSNDLEVSVMLKRIIREEEQHVIKLKEMIYFKKTHISVEEHIRFIQNILDGMTDWVRVIDLEDNIIYTNNAMKLDLGQSLVGKKCYQVIGRTTPCENCISMQAAKTEIQRHKEETIAGKIYSVMSSPLKNADGEVEAVVEVLRDVTKAKQMEIKLKEHNEKLTTDLQIARKMQYSLLPKKLKTDLFDFNYVYVPCEEIGGDFFDIFFIDENHFGLYIADVSGHGVPASMLTMFLRQTINKNILSPAQSLSQLFQVFNDADFDESWYITMFYAVIDFSANTITYANAGHNAPPILFNYNGPERLEASGIPISNWVSDPVYEEYVKPLHEGDKLMFFTDGIIELRNSFMEMFGDLRLEEFIFKNREKHIKEIKELLLKEMYKFSFEESTSEKSFDDDITMFFVEIKKKMEFLC